MIDFLYFNIETPFQFNYIMHKTFELRSDNDNRIHVAAVQKPRLKSTDLQGVVTVVLQLQLSTIVRVHIIYVYTCNNTFVVVALLDVSLLSLFFFI